MSVCKAKSGDAESRCALGAMCADDPVQVRSPRRCKQPRPYLYENDIGIPANVRRPLSGVAVPLSATTRPGALTTSALSSVTSKISRPNPRHRRRSPNSKHQSRYRRASLSLIRAVPGRRGVIGFGPNQREFWERALAPRPELEAREWMDDFIPLRGGRSVILL